MTMNLQNMLGTRWRVWACALSCLVSLGLLPVTPTHAATEGKTRVTKSYAKSVKGSKTAKASAVKKRVAVKKRRASTVVAKRRAVKQPRVVVAEKQSYGEIAGLHATSDALNLKSSVALVVDQQTNEVLYSKNDKAVLPIASLTKLMTGLIISDSNLPSEDLITVTVEDVDTEKGSHSRLRVGSVLTRGELLHLALMSSENRAAHALGRTYPGGLSVFVARMNAKARALGMNDTVYVEPTGLSSSNQSSAHDLVKLVDAAHQQPLLRELTTSPGYEVALGRRTLQYNNTNRLVKNPTWDIGLQKTGYISEAGRCLVMQASVAGRDLIMVFLDSAGKLTRLADAERVRRWVESTTDAVADRRSGVALSGR